MVSSHFDRSIQRSLKIALMCAIQNPSVVWKFTSNTLIFQTEIILRVGMKVLFKWQRVKEQNWPVLQITPTVHVVSPDSFHQIQLLFLMLNCLISKIQSNLLLPNKHSKITCNFTLCKLHINPPTQFFLSRTNSSHQFYLKILNDHLSENLDLTIHRDIQF